MVVYVRRNKRVLYESPDIQFTHQVTTDGALRFDKAVSNVRSARWEYLARYHDDTVGETIHPSWCLRVVSTMYSERAKSRRVLHPLHSLTHPVEKITCRKENERVHNCTFCPLAILVDITTRFELQIVLNQEPLIFGSGTPFIIKTQGDHQVCICQIVITQ
jgi:hypothetical protein